MIDEDRPNVRFPDDAPTPVGQVCSDCKEEFVLGDWGQFVPWMLDGGAMVKPIHGECLVREVMGGIEHLTAPPGHEHGSCYEGSTMTRRESALAAFAWLREHRGDL